MAQRRAGRESRHRVHRCDRLPDRHAFAGTWGGAGLHAVWHLAGLAACHLLIAFFAADAGVTRRHPA